MRTHFVRALVFLTALGLLAATSCVLRTGPGHSKHPSTHKHSKHKKAKKHKKHKKAKKHKKHKHR